MLTLAEIKAIRKRLPRGFIRKIAIATNLSESTVEKFFYQHRYNRSVHNAAVNLANETQEEIKNIQSQLA